MRAAKVFGILFITGMALALLSAAGQLFQLVGHVLGMAEAGPDAGLAVAHRVVDGRGVLTDLGIPVEVALLVTIAYLLGYAWVAWQVGTAFSEIAEAQALETNAASRLRLGGLVILASQFVQSGLDTWWARTQEHHPIWWLYPDAFEVGTLAFAGLLFVLGVVIRDASEIAAEHALTV